mmetsp:Transcript_37020/g.80642  ORF Transcript_37020/g.80642 Transcript_37020/m.80642 type:complete len:332 (+) Transcript_37020:203-1198(+)
MDTFDSASAFSRSPSLLPVSWVPSRPASGLSLTPKVILMVGGSMGLVGMGASTVIAATVSVTVASGIPAMDTMSPTLASSRMARLMPCRVKSLVTRPSVRGAAPSSLVQMSAFTRSPTRTWPELTRPVRRRPMKLSRSIMVTNMRKSDSTTPLGGGTFSTTASSSADIPISTVSPAAFRFSSSCALSQLSAAMPSRAEAYRVRKSSWSSFAPRAANRSNRSCSTSMHRSSVTEGRSILFSTSRGCSPRASALDTTNFVWAKGPSRASTSRIQPSTIDSTRSTSPPKSACPGVSTALRVRPFHWKDVYFDWIVIPRSFSKSLLSIARSTATA